MRDPEFIELRKRFTLGIIIVLLISVPFLIFITKKFMVETSPIIKGINENKTMLVLVEKVDCDTCKDIENIIDSYGVKYYKLNSQSDRSYLTIIYKMGITRKDIVEPTLVYIKEGKYYASLPSVNSAEDIKSFLLVYGFLDE